MDLRLGFRASPMPSTTNNKTTTGDSDLGTPHLCRMAGLRRTRVERGRGGRMAKPTCCAEQVDGRTRAHRIAGWTALLSARNRGRERCSRATGPLVYPKHAAFCPSFSSFCSCCSALPWLTPVSATRAGPSTVRRNGPPHLTKAPRSSGRAVTARSRRAEGHVFETLHC